MAKQLPCLPAELLSQIFLEVDPHTLYTSIRCLSREWKKQVEENLLKSEFESNRWRVGLRVTRKPKSGKQWRGGIVGSQGALAPGAEWEQIKSKVEAFNGGSSQEELDRAHGQAQERHTKLILERHGALEDELPAAMVGEPFSPLTHVVPLHFKCYKGDSAMLHFGTRSAEWHALFETGKEEGESSRLDLDFSIVWRFPGDGQSDDELDGWGVPDQENGWLSRFYCSDFDMTSNVEPFEIQEDVQQVLTTTPLARRVRQRQVILQQESSHPDISSKPTLEWSDQGHEYMSLCLSLGTEFFVRRSAQANLLMRRLEVEAEADKQRQSNGHKRERREMPSRIPSAISTPQRSNSSVANSPSCKSLVDPNNRLQGKRNASTAQSSGMTTPMTWSQGARTSSSSSSTPSYATIASTPTVGCLSPRGLVFRSKALPRIAKLQQDSQLYGRIRAPYPSTNVSGYSSVKHQSRTDDKRAEVMSSSSGSLETTMSSSSITSPTSDLSLSSSPRRHLLGHSSAPRACFSAQLYHSSPSSLALHWTARADSPNLFTRNMLHTSSIPITTWAWTR